MLENLVPDKYFKSIYDINYKSLKESGIKCLIFDISNTLESETTVSPSRKVKDLFEDLKEMDFKNDYTPREKEANIFAAELLMPTEEFKNFFQEE